MGRGDTEREKDMDECEIEILKKRSQKLAQVERDLRSFLKYVDVDYPLFASRFNFHVRKMVKHVGGPVGPSLQRRLARVRP